MMTSLNLKKFINYVYFDAKQWQRRREDVNVKIFGNGNRKNNENASTVRSRRLSNFMVKCEKQFR